MKTQSTLQYKYEDWDWTFLLEDNRSNPWATAAP